MLFVGFRPCLSDESRRPFSVLAWRIFDSCVVCVACTQLVAYLFHLFDDEFCHRGYVVYGGPLASGRVTCLAFLLPAFLH